MNIRKYINADTGFVAFVITVGLSTIFAALAIFSYVGAGLGIGIASQIPPAVEELGMFAALLLGLFYLITEVIGDVS